MRTSASLTTSLRHVITQGRHAAHPHALFLGGGDLVADSFAGDFPLELGEGKQDVQRQPSHAGGGVELLGDRHKRDAAAVKDVDELGKIGERASTRSPAASVGTSTFST